MAKSYALIYNSDRDNRFDANQFNFETGTIIGRPGNENTFKILDRQNTEVWSVPIDESEWQNFAVTLDFDKK